MAQVEDKIVALGWVPIPLPPKTKAPVVDKWQQLTAAEGLEQIKTKRRGRGCNVGILTGIPSGIVVVDIDLRPAKDPKYNGMTGLEVWNYLSSIHGVISNTFVVQTGSGGYHIYFKYDERMTTLGNRNINELGIDFRTTGGQVVAWDSIHPNENLYKPYTGFIQDETGFRVVLDTMPDWVLKLVS